MTATREPGTSFSSSWLRFISLAAFVVVWLIAAEIANSRYLPSPVTVAQSLVEHLFEGKLIENILITLGRAALAFAISMVVGVAIGLALGRSKGLDRFFDGWLVLGLNMPALVVAILSYIWFGLTEFALILAVCINKIPNVIATVREGARAIEPDLIEVGRVYRLTRFRQLLHIYLPQLYPYIVAAARSGLALIWKIVLLFELLGRGSGVGFQLQVFFQFFDITSILAYAFAFIGVVLAIEGFLIRPIERRLTAWRL